MPISIVERALHYTIATPIYQGPLDLLLQLIERAELDITKLALAQVTDQYLEYLHSMSELPPEEVSAFLVIAAKLLQIKSEVLLPRPLVHEDDEEDAGEALARQLLTYRRYKKVADFLEQREHLGLKTFLRLAPPPKVEGRVDLGGLGLADLVEAGRACLCRDDRRLPLASVVPLPRVTIRQKISLIAGLLRQRGRATFRALLVNTRSRLEIVVTFLAMLELIKRRMVHVTQENLFGEIEIEPAEQWDEGEDFELEFSE
jgi:segregation and condensation protein A